MKITGSFIRKQRLHIGLSQAKLSELSGISQHLLSSFELEKTELPPVLIDALKLALSNKEKVIDITKRKKRYQKHQYFDIQRNTERVSQAYQTKENISYVNLLNKLAKQHCLNEDSKLTALSLFSGCGGFSLGFSAAGFKIKGFVELESELRNIYKANFPDSVEIGGDITQLDADILNELSKKFGEIDVVIGGPPCQGFSLSGKRNINDPRNQLFKHYLKVVDIFQPKIAVLENVKLLTSMKNESGGYVKEDICLAFKQHGYKIRYFEINAKNYGVPQHRERVLFIAVRNDIIHEPSIPNITHGDTFDIFSEVLPYRTFADACSDLVFLESGECSEQDNLHQTVKHPAHVIDWLWDVPQGYSAHDNQDPNKRPPSGYNTTYKRQIWSEPASTVQTTFGMISGCRNVHPIATRSLTIREAARIQSFPDSYQFVGNLGVIRTGIGNAVPPLLAYTIACYLKDYIL